MNSIELRVLNKGKSFVRNTFKNTTCGDSVLLGTTL